MELRLSCISPSICLYKSLQVNIMSWAFPIVIHFNAVCLLDQEQKTVRQPGCPESPTCYDRAVWCQAMTNGTHASLVINIEANTDLARPLKYIIFLQILTTETPIAEYPYFTTNILTVNSGHIDIMLPAINLWTEYGYYTSIPSSASISRHQIQNKIFFPIFMFDNDTEYVWLIRWHNLNAWQDLISKHFVC